MVYGVENQETVYLIDFGCSSKFTTDQGKHTVDAMDHSYKGNLMFASMNICRGSSLSRRDDVESIIYILIYMLDKKMLPWTKLEHNVLTGELTLQNVRSLRSTAEAVQEVSKCLPSELAVHYHKITKLRFSEEPDYDGFTACL